MKSIIAISLLVCNVALVEAHKLHLVQHHRQSDETNASLDEDLDSLMDKYDTGNSQKAAGFKPSPSKADAYAKGGPSAAQVSEVEF